jgi:hypothetical protein
MAKSKRKTTGDNTDNALRKHLIYLLRGRGAHLSADAAFRNLPHKARGIRPPGAQHSLWELLEHMRIAQWDILDFCRNPNYEHLDFPQGYWPKTPAPPNRAAWDKSLRAFRADLKAMEKLVASPETNLYARIPWGSGQTILREAFLIADHNAYHLGQVVLARRLLGAWPAGKRSSL